MNARLGGGYPFSHIAGCNLPKAIVDWTLGKVVYTKQLTAKIGIKSFKEIYINKKYYKN